MIIASVENEYKEIQTRLSKTSIKDEVCMIHDRDTQKKYVITSKHNFDVLNQYLIVNDVNEYSDEKKGILFHADNLEISGRKDFLGF